MEWAKAPPELVALWEEVAPAAPGVERRKMFGYPAAFTNGNMFAGLHGASLVLRLPADVLAEFMTLPGAKPFEPMPGRPMSGYAVAPSTLVSDRVALSRWLERSFEEAAKLPAKKTKPKKG
ncbi:MAG: TfoX/Sxy family protein [Chloroflexota bacterium]|nr:TfoX/Sxy family protein [Chloroflexota bacterium]